MTTQHSPETLRQHFPARLERFLSNPTTVTLRWLEPTQWPSGTGTDCRDIASGPPDRRGRQAPRRSVARSSFNDDGKRDAVRRDAGGGSVDRDGTTLSNVDVQVCR